MVRKATRADLQDIGKIYQIARTFMRNNGNPTQWGENHPPADLLESDIEKGQLYVIADNQGIHGVFAFIIGEEPTYGSIESGSWTNDEQYGTIHRIASRGTRKGIFGTCLDYCKTLCDNLRIDTHPDNKAMRYLIEKNGFARCGIIHVEDGSPRIAYQYAPPVSVRIPTI